MIWKILEIEETKDTDLITKAYHDKLHYVNPEDNPEGFKELRSAYEKALEYANTPEDDGLHNDEFNSDGSKKNEVDHWIDKVSKVYEDVAKRRDVNEWKRLFKDPVCEDLDMELEAGEKLLVFFMSHANLPQNIWQEVDKQFDVAQNADILKEKFAENYIDYVLWQIKSPSFIDYSLFDGKTDDHVDEYISILYDEKAAFDEAELDKAESLLDKLESFELKHPFSSVERALILLAKAKRMTEENGEEKSDEADKLNKEALEMMEDLEFEYSENPYIIRVYARALTENKQYDKAMEVYDDLLEKYEDSTVGMYGKAECTYLKGDIETAKDMIEDVLEYSVQDGPSLQLLDEMNEKLEKVYLEEIEKNPEDLDTIIKLCWVYYQQKRFEEGVELIEKAPEAPEDYDYINARCRLYLAIEKNDLAMPYVRKWLKMIEESEDDGSREMIKRKNRLSLAHFSLGVCLWTQTKEKILSENDDKNYFDEELFKESIDSLMKGVSEEKTVLVKLSYLEQLARFYLDAGENERCVKVCNQIIEEDKGFFPAYVHRQKANYNLRNAKEVIDDFFNCKEIYPAYAKPYVYAAEVFFDFEQYDDVKNVLEEAKNAEIQSDALDFMAVKLIRFEDFSKENVQDAISKLKLLRARVYENKEETDLEDFEELEREFAIFYWDNDEPEKAISIIDEALKTMENASSLYHLKADIISRMGKYTEAVDIYKKAVELNKDNLYVRVKYGTSLERVDRDEEARQLYLDILKINPDYVPANRRMMYLCGYMNGNGHNLEMTEEAIKYATKYIELTGESEGYLERGNLYIDLYELDKAVEDCIKSIELDDKAYYAYNNLGCALLKLRRIDEAIKPLNDAINLDPKKDYLPYLNLAECYTVTGKYNEAIETYKKALEMWPEKESLFDDLIKVYQMAGMYDKAAECYSRKINNYETELGVKMKSSIGVGRVKDFESRFLKDNKTSTDSQTIAKYRELFNLYVKMGENYWRKYLYTKDSSDLTKAEKFYKKFLESRKAGHDYFSIAELCEFYRDSDRADKAYELMSPLIFDNENEQSGNYNQLRFVFSTVLLELDKMDLAKEYAKKTIDFKIKNYDGDIDKYLADKRYLAMRAYDLAILNICMGELDKAEEFLKKIKENHQCVICTFCDCFEYYFGMGLIYEKRGLIDKASEMYKQAIKVRGIYPAAFNHLNRISKK